MWFAPFFGVGINIQYLQWKSHPGNTRKGWQLLDKKGLWSQQCPCRHGSDYSGNLDRLSTLNVGGPFILKVMPFGSTLYEMEAQSISTYTLFKSDNWILHKQLILSQILRYSFWRLRMTAFKLSQTWAVSLDM